jgi:hypothetical protein
VIRHSLRCQQLRIGPVALDADVEVVPVMNADDLQKGFGKLG